MKRRYTLSEIDKLRMKIRAKLYPQQVCWAQGYEPGQRQQLRQDQHVEDQLRTALSAGVDPDEDFS